MQISWSYLILNREREREREKQQETIITDTHIHSNSIENGSKVVVAVAAAAATSAQYNHANNGSHKYVKWTRCTIGRTKIWNINPKSNFCWRNQVCNGHRTCVRLHLSFNYFSILI